MWRKMIALFCILLGLLLIATPFLKDQMVAHLQKKNQATELTGKEVAENRALRARYDYDTIQPPSVMNVMKASLKDYKQSIVGQISIKQVGLELPILKGMTSDNLLAGAGTMRADQQMGVGNYPLAGHHMKRTHLLFGPLLEVKKGARIELTDFQSTYVYKVTDKQIVSEKEMDVIGPSEGSKVTLVTCDVPTETNKRLIVQGELVSKKPYRK
ncbi:class A sortase [Bacillus sp. 1P06AnD]|uniref:class A sortase n=1 Tax=Bacillus sp. 1P06AnD TaxID=3132208 RepID=UPI00399FE06B